VEPKEAEELTPQELKKVLAAIFRRSQTDAAFRTLCLKSPEEAVFEVSGRRLPLGSRMRFDEPESENAN
jgi:hypothetical protein